jgi:hypothetical protein
MPDTGFTFDFPNRWLNEETDFKAIGIRRLNVVPTSHVFTLIFNIHYKAVDKTKEYDAKLRRRLTITAENSFEEVIHALLNVLNAGLRETKLKPYDGIGGRELRYIGEYAAFTYTFDYKTGKFTLRLTQGNTNAFEKLQFNVEGDAHSDLAVNNINHFLKFMNQQTTDRNRNKLTNYTGSKTFYSVWDRVSLQFHASFSNNKRNFIGLNKDFYISPSVFYDGPTNASDFWVKFTTDGRNQFLPRYCRFYIGISFVRNYKNSLVTK